MNPNSPAKKVGSNSGFNFVFILEAEFLNEITSMSVLDKLVACGMKI